MLARLLVVALTFFPLAARACDLCGCYSPQVESMPNERVSLTGFYTAIAEQFTHFGSLQFDDREVANPTGQRLDSSVTQFVIGYEINDRLAVQFNAPFIYRDFRRPEGFAIDEGNVSGLGDVSLLAKDLTWNAGPGYYLVRKRETLVGCQCAVSGESKDVDRFQGRAAEDTGVTSVFVGPRIIASHNQISGELAAEFPVLMNTTAFQAVPDYRLHASIAVSW